MNVFDKKIIQDILIVKRFTDMKTIIYTESNCSLAVGIDLFFKRSF